LSLSNDSHSKNVESLQSDRVFEEELSLLIIGRERERWFRGLTRLRIAQPIRWLGPEVPKQPAATCTTLTTRRTWLVFWTPPYQNFTTVVYNDEQQYIMQWDQTQQAVGGMPTQYAPARPFDLESGVRVTCDMGYLCANFSLPRHLCSRLRPDVCERQTLGVRQHHCLTPPPA